MVDTINPNITAGIGGGGGQINALDMLQHYAATQNALNQNALFQQTFRARQAMGPLMQQATDTQTGQVDWDKAATLVATHPATSFMAPEFLNNIAQKKLLDAETTNQKLTATKGRMDIMAGVWSAAAKDGGVKDVSDLTPYLSQAMSVGGIKDPKDAVAFMADPKIAGLKGPEFRQMLLQHALAMQHGSNALTALNNTYKEDAFHDANGNPIPGWINPTRQTATPAVGSAAMPGQQDTSALGGQTQQPQQLGGGQAQQPNAGQPAPANAGAPPVLGPVGPLQKQLMSQQGDYQKNVNDEATFGAKSDLLLGELDKALQGTKTGAGTSHYVEAAKLLKTFGVSDKYVDEVAGGNLGHLQEAQKLMLQVATGSLRAALLPGAGRLTNTEFNAFREANPNIDIDPRATQKLIAFQRQMNMLAQKKAQAYSLAYGAAAHGGQMPNGLPDITQFEPYWISKLQKAGFIGQESADKLSGSAQ